MKKFIRRHKVGVLAGSAIAAALIVGLVLASVGFYQARRQARITREKSITALWGWSRSLTYDGEFARAEACAREALATSKELYGRDDPIVATSLHFLAGAVEKSKPQEAIGLERDAIATFKKYPDSGDDDLLWATDHLAILLVHNGQPAEAESIFRETLAIWRGRVGNNHLYVANTLDHLADALMQQGKHADAEKCLRECVAIRRRLRGDKNSATIRTFNTLINLIERQGRHPEAEKLIREAADPKPTTKPESK